MCLGIPGRIVEVTDGSDLARIDVSGVVRNINIGMLTDERLVPGDWVLIHVGFAMERMDEQQALDALEFLEEIDRAYGSPDDQNQNSVVATSDHGLGSPP